MRPPQPAVYLYLLDVSFNAVETGKNPRCAKKKCIVVNLKFKTGRPASVAQLDERLTGDQEVTGSTPAGSRNILSWRLVMKYFLR